MRIIFKKIPRLAIVFYIAGFSIIVAAFFLYFKRLEWFEFFTIIRIQQLFILGAIVVAIGSVINNLSQFKKANKSN